MQRYGNQNEEAWAILKQIAQHNNRMLEHAFNQRAKGKKITSPLGPKSAEKTKVAYMELLQQIMRLSNSVKSINEWHAINTAENTSLFKFACENGLAAQLVGILTNDQALNSRPKPYLESLISTLEAFQDNSPPIKAYSPEMKKGARNQWITVEKMIATLEGALTMHTPPPKPKWLH